MGHYDWCAVHAGEHDEIVGVCHPHVAGAPSIDDLPGPFTRPTQPANPSAATFGDLIAERWDELTKDLKPGYAKGTDRLKKTALGIDEKDVMSQELFATAIALIKAAMPGLNEYAVFSHARKMLLRAAGLEDEP